MSTALCTDSEYSGPLQARMSYASWSAPAGQCYLNGTINTAKLFTQKALGGWQVTIYYGHNIICAGQLRNVAPGQLSHTQLDTPSHRHSHSFS